LINRSVIGSEGMLFFNVIKKLQSESSFAQRTVAKSNRVTGFFLTWPGDVPNSSRLGPVMRHVVIIGCCLGAL